MHVRQAPPKNDHVGITRYVSAHCNTIRFTQLCPRRPPAARLSHSSPPAARLPSSRTAHSKTEQQPRQRKLARAQLRMHRCNPNAGRRRGGIGAHGQHVLVGLRSCVSLAAWCGQLLVFAASVPARAHRASPPVTSRRPSAHLTKCARRAVSASTCARLPGNASVGDWQLPTAAGMPVAWRRLVDGAAVAVGTAGVFAAAWRRRRRSLAAYALREETQGDAGHRTHGGGSWCWCWWLRPSLLALLGIHSVAGTSTARGDGGRARVLLLLCRCAALWRSTWLRTWLQVWVSKLWAQQVEQVGLQQG